MTTNLKKFLLADEKRTQGEWEHGHYDGNIMTSKTTPNGRKHVADTRNSTEMVNIANNATFIALSSTIAPEIKELLKVCKEMYGVIEHVVDVGNHYHWEILSDPRGRLHGISNKALAAAEPFREIWETV